MSRVVNFLAPIAIGARPATGSSSAPTRGSIPGVSIAFAAAVLFTIAGAVALPDTSHAAAAGAAAATEGAHDGAHGDDHGHHSEIGERGVDPSPAEFRSDLAIWSLAVFGLLLALLGKFAWKPIMDGLDKREQGIAHQIAETKTANEEAKRMLVSYERRLAEASDEVRGMLEEARRDADSTRHSIVAEARKAAEDEQARAKHEIGLARDEALSSIAQKAGDLAVEVAGKFLREKIGKEDHSRLIHDSVAGLASARGTKPSVN